MSATIIWSIEYMQCKPVEGSYADVVINAGWRCNGMQNTYAANLYGSVGFLAPEGTFIPYEQLTEEQVLNWCWSNGVDKIATEASVQTLIDAQINPPIIQPPLPWVSA